MTDASGVRTSESRYKAWGETRYASGTLPTTYKFTGQREESYINLYWYNSRWYDPALGRFVQPDSIIPSQTDPLSWDRYCYTLNNPVRYNDPSGHCPWCVVIGAVVGAAVGYGAQVVNNYQNDVANPWTTNISAETILGGAVAGATAGLGVGVVSVIAGGGAAAAGGAGAATAATTTIVNATGGDPSDEINAFGDLGQAASYGVQPANQLKNAVSGTGLQVHHVVEQRLAPALGQTATQARQWSGVAVTPQEHQAFTNAWRSAIGYNNQAMEWITNNANPAVIWEKAQAIYAEYPALLDAAKQTIFAK